MAIAFDNATFSTVTGATSLTFSHTVGVGSDRFLVVFIEVGAGAGDVITGVTYNGDAMTRSADATLVDFSTNQSFWTYYLINPDSGANNVVISSSASRNIRGYAQSYTGCLQSGQPDNAATISGDGTFTIVTSADNCWLAGGGRSLAVGDLTASTDTVERVGDSNMTCGDSNGDKTPAGSYALNWTPDDADTYGVIISIAPSLSSGPANLKTYNTNPKANIKTINTNPIANVKSLNTNT